MAGAGGRQLMAVLERADRDRVALLTLNRPDARNALTTELLCLLRDHLADIADSPGVGAVVLAGAHGTFCAGADLKEFAGKTSENGRLRRVRLVSQVIAQLRNLEQPTIASVSGAAVGAGWGLALGCDVTFASADARFSLPELRKGLRLPPAITTRLVEVVGPVRAAELALGGAIRDAASGAAAGWVARTFDDERTTLDHARKFAEQLAAVPGPVVAAVKQVLRRGSGSVLAPPPEYAWSEENGE
jgi:enoyl-CoA hydratase